MTRHYTISLLMLCSIPFSTHLYADAQDTRLRIEQQDALTAQKKESKILEEEREKEQANTQPATPLDIDLNDPNQVAQALYLSVKNQQWDSVEDLLDLYRQFEHADPLLVHYAQGGVYRVKGELTKAEQEYTALLVYQADFLPAKLELARVLFENNKNSDAQSLFNEIALALPADNPRSKGVRKTIEAFTLALNTRDAWSGSFSLGPSFNDNLNSSSESYTCLLRDNVGQCIIDRVTPDKERAYGLDYEASLNKRFSLSGHHGIVVQGQTYGSQYRHHEDYNENTSRIALGYSYHSQAHRISLSPQFEYNGFGGKTLYLGSAVKVDWLATLNRQSAIKFETKAEYQDYLPKQLHYQSDWQFSSLATIWYQTSNKWLLFGGVDWTDKRNKQSVHAYQVVGARVGVNKSIDSLIDASLFASFRDRRYQAFSALLDEKRHDQEQNYTLILSSPAFNFYGITPSLSWTHKRVESNVDWLYTYQQNEVSLKLVKRF
ncbi:surface lipoprotein assembly modifier [Vibrio sinaloensis]|uniref:surface lipoprotein assembly modifier n=1 Tax=Photobacterium sp. (strain ATCC 43367) TaxID=379097 RepID=UPI0035EE28D5